MSDFTAYTHPVLAVACPDCGGKAGAWCQRPSGHRASDFHLSRKAEADRAFIERHGPDASIVCTADGWTIDPRGRVGIRPSPEPRQGVLL